MFRKIISARKECLNKDNYNLTLDMWINRLIDIALSIFVYDYDGYGEYILTQEIEKNLIFFGSCVISQIDGKIIAFPCSTFTPTYYYDFFTNATVTSPVASFAVNLRQFKDIKKYPFNDNADGVLIYNDKTHNGIFDLILHYADMLTHLDLSIKNVSINMREPALVPTASATKFINVLKDYRKKIFSGSYMPIEDLGFSTIKFVENKNQPSGYLSELLESRKKLMQEYYNLCGIKTSLEKKGNLINEEINANNDMLTINIADMLESRKQGLEMVNDAYGLKLNVERRLGDAS